MDQPGYSVGWFTNNNEWIVETIWETKAEAAARISYLNGGKFFGGKNELITIEKSKRSPSGLNMNDIIKWHNLNTKITELCFSVRVTNTLIAADINSLGELVEYNINDLLKFRCFGKKSLAEIKNFLLTKGLSFKTVE